MTGLSNDNDFEELTCEEMRDLSDWLFSHADRRREISTWTADEQREIDHRETLAKKLKRMMVKKGCP